MKTKTELDSVFEYPDTPGYMEKILREITVVIGVAILLFIACATMMVIVASWIF